MEAAEKLDRAAAAMKGYLKKKNSAGHWQKRWFEIVGQYFVYVLRAGPGRVGGGVEGLGCVTARGALSASYAPLPRCKYQACW